MEKYRKLVLFVLVGLTAIVNLVLIDVYIIPKKIENDKILYYSKLEYTRSTKFGSSKVYIGYRFMTQRGYQFSLEKCYIDEDEITTESSRIFKIITSVRGKSEDYSKKLMSGLNGISLYVFIMLSISSITSIVILTNRKKITENTFQNIILFNLFLMFVVCVIYLAT